VPEFEDKYWWSDNLRLHYRDYPGPDDRPPILCIPGLTRNARDFEPVAERLAGQWRLICVDLRGRAESAYAKDPMTYVPLTYLQDLMRLFEAINLRRFVGFGTSLGGLLLMLVASAAAQRLAGALINDIGPTIEEVGLARIRGNVGNGSTFPTWVHAARALAETNAAIYPDYELHDWITFAKRLYRLNSKGRIVLDYDQRIAEPFRQPGNEAGVDLWPTLTGFASCPVTVLRGGLSDILSAETAQKMCSLLPDAELVTLPRIGHAPALTEPESVAAIDRLLTRVLAGQGA
jgi:pimeloyl-ACP methyl ester carboxylesterase